MYIHQQAHTAHDSRVEVHTETDGMREVWQSQVARVYDDDGSLEVIATEGGTQILCSSDPLPAPVAAALGLQLLAYAGVPVRADALPDNTPEPLRQLASQLSAPAEGERHG